MVDDSSSAQMRRRPEPRKMDSADCIAVALRIHAFGDQPKLIAVINGLHFFAYGCQPSLQLSPGIREPVCDHLDPTLP